MHSTKQEIRKPRVYRALNAPPGSDDQQDIWGRMK